MIVSIEYEHEGKRFSAHANLPEIPEDAIIIGAEKTVWVGSDEGLGDMLISAIEGTGELMERLKR